MFGRIARSSSPRAGRIGGGRSRRMLRGIAVVLTGGVLAWLLVPGVEASAAIGASSAPLSTAAPDLRTSSVLDVPTSKVQFCFDQPVANFGGNAGKFHLNGYNDAVGTTGSAIGVDPNPQCVDVTFANSSSDVSQYSIVTVDVGALSNSANTNLNVEGAATLGNAAL